jgi:hypothetical protein
MMAVRVKKEVLRELLSDLEGAPYRSRSAVVTRWAERLSCSPDTVYRLARRAGWFSGRKERTDAGSSKSGLDREALLLIAREKRRASRNDGNRGKRTIMYTTAAVEEVKAKHGKRITASPHTVNRHLRRLGLVNDALNRPHPHMPLRSLHPNHVHQIDASVCINYRFEERGMVFDLFEKNKIERVVEYKKRVLRLLLLDHFSGAFFFAYVLAAGEGRAEFIDFLHECWSPKDASFPFCGLPKILYADKTSALDSPHLADFWDSLGVELITQSPRQGDGGGLDATRGGVFRVAPALAPALLHRGA